VSDFQQTPAERFRELATRAAKLNIPATDLVELPVILSTVDAMNSRTREAILNPPPSYIPTYNHARRIRDDAQRILTANIRAMAQRSLDRASGAKRLVVAKCAEPVMDNPLARERRERDVELYWSQLSVMDDAEITIEAETVTTSPLLPGRYAEARSLARELRRRGLVGLECDVENHLHASKTAWQTDPAYTAADERLQRADAWRVANGPDVEDPTISILVGAESASCRVSELLVQDAEIDAGAPPKPAKPAGGMVMHGMRKRP
jgi:hypothetical protein